MVSFYNHIYIKINRKKRVKDYFHQVQGLYNNDTTNALNKKKTNLF